MFEINKDYPGNFRSPQYRKIVKQVCGIRESDSPDYGPKGRRIKEQLVKCIWSGQFMKKRNLYTEDGARIEILSPGHWNVEEGPDFKGAEILLEEKGVAKGDVEIHVFADDWKR